MSDATTPTAPNAEHDPYLWLEEVTGESALQWVRQRNAETEARLAVGERFEHIRAQAREVLDSDEKIPYVRRRGDYLYNFWQDAEHPRGLWRRTTLESYRTADPDWEILLDVDALGAAESENWVWKGAAVLRPDYRLCLVQLSRGGADATVVREFDLKTKTFVTDGFVLPEAKTSVAWIDADHIYVGTDFGPGSLTSSGYPRIVKKWRRGTPLAEAVTVFEGKPDDVAVSAFRDHTEGFERDFVRRAIDFYTSERYLYRDGQLELVDVPRDATIGVHREWLLIRPRTPWTVNGVTYPDGALLATPFDAYLAGERSFELLFAPDDHTSLTYYAWTRNHLILNTLRDVTSRLVVWTPPSSDTDSTGGWTQSTLEGVPELGHTDIVDTDPDASDEYFLASSGFTQPATLWYGHVGGSIEVVKQAPHFFDASNLSVRQRFATSRDGTKIPYFIVGPENPSEDAPTLLTGYGGFEVSLTPSYNGVIGRGWLARGGTYVVANLRGGGEYGPRWHRSALRENRIKAYEDFAAVARDLIDQGITTRRRLGIQGGSNGGLLMGVMLTRYPELFGAIVCQVPLLDMRRYHLMLAGASWMAEYGNPDDEADWAFIRTYSPYHNVRRMRTTRRCSSSRRPATTGCIPVTRARWRRVCSSTATT
ncbi:MAG TPA: prolyl oligopeptidase family serine peptidase [Actinopolymorphaceae bacterium]